MKNILTVFIIIFFASCKTESKNRLSKLETVIAIDTLQGTSLLDTPLIQKQIDDKRDSQQLTNYRFALEKYAEEASADNIIWFGRRMAYLGDYKKAIEIYTEGIEKFPNDPRMYRHRGHRYISIRQFDKSIADFNQAVLLIQGRENQIEPDGIPNKYNTPVSTLHGNIYYHLGLAHYLKNELPNALIAFNKCLATSTNNDNQVSSKHWLYMIHRRLGNSKKAEALLEPISKDIKIIENTAYHQLLLFYKNELTEQELTGANSLGASEAVQYGVANWHHYNGNLEKAKELYEYLVINGNWAGFGYIAAEADLSRMK